MRRWKKILLGVFGGVALGGLCYLHTVTSQAVTIRNGPAGNSRQENVAIALLDTLHTDGSFSPVNIDSGAIDNTGINDSPVGSSTASTGAFTTLSSTGAVTGGGTETRTVTDAGTANQALALELIHETTGTPTTNIGVSIDLTAETSASNNEKLVKLSALAEDTTAAGEDGAFIVSVMGAGATATEQFRVGTATISMLDNDVSNVGDIAVDSISADGTNVEVTSPLFISSTLQVGTDTLTTDSADPGTATATLAEIITYLISDNTGTEQDVVTLPDGTLGGQPKRFIYQTDNETSGIVIAPTSVTMVGGAGTGTLLEDAGDYVEFTWDATLGWTLTGNIGGTIQ